MTVRSGARALSLAVVASLVTFTMSGASRLTLREPAAEPRVQAPATLEAAAVPADPFARSARDRALTGPPTRLRIGAVGIDTTLERLSIGALGELEPPKSNDRAGWYAGGTAPGDVGPAVLAGHVDSRSGPAVFFRLRDVRRGDRIEVTRGGTPVVFTVTATAWYPKRAFPADRVYGPTPDRQLRLITCGGSFDRAARSYRENLVVYAVAG